MANTHLKPEGLGTVTPYFTVENADLMISFLKSVFAASVIKENRYPDSSIQHARMRIGDSVIMLNETTDMYPSIISQMHVFVEDCHATYGLALELGATSLMAPNVRSHGDRMAGIHDPCGNIWWIASHLPRD